ncbi:MAG: sialidase family protein [Pirellulaceae bacterium]|nr:sialidase family protein [Pirellulaceae bacterium]
MNQQHSKLGALLILMLISLDCFSQPAADHKKDTTLEPPKGLKTKLPPGYTIPIVDISSEKERQIIVDREPGQYLGHPTTVLLEDNKTMLTVYPKGHGRGAIVYKRSNDGGKTWSERLPTPKSWESSLEVPTLHRVIDAAGKKRIIMFSGLYPIRMAVTEDDGSTWSELKPIGNFGGVVTMASVIDLKTPGYYLAFFHDDGRFIRGGEEEKYRVRTPHSDHTSPTAKPWRFWVFTSLSKDGGLTWSIPAPIAMLPDASLCEPGAIRSPDGKQIAVVLRENSRKYNSFVIFSNDEGLTWTEPRELPAALTGDRHVAKYAPDGRLFISFRDTTHVSPTKGDWVGWVGTYDDIVKGNDGQYRIRIMDNTKGSDCTYPGVELLPDGTFVTTTYGHWTEGELAYVVSVRFTLSELDAKLKK